MKTTMFKGCTRFIILGLTIFILSVPTYCQPIDIFKIPWKSLSHYQKYLRTSEQNITKLMGSMTEYKIKVRISDDYQSLKGYQEVLYTNNETVILHEICFRLFPNMNGGSMVVTDLEIESQSFSKNINRKNTVLNIKLSKPIVPSAQIKIKMHFEVIYPNDLRGNYGQFAFYENILVSANFFPIIPVYNHKGWQLELAPSNADYVHTDVALFMVQITTPLKFIIVASGNQIDSQESNYKKTTTHVIGPARDFYFAGSEYFSSVLKKSNGISIESYASFKNLAGSELAADITIDTLEYMSQKLGPYPYLSFKIVSAPTLAMGIEYPGVVVIARRFYNLNRRYKKLTDIIFMETTLIHEVIHQWFYNMVGNDQVNEPWLDEAVTQYYTWRYYNDHKQQKSANALLQYYHKRMNSIIKPSLPIGLATYQYSPNSYSPIVYSKGPLFFMELEKTLTREVFDRAMQLYFSKYKWKISQGNNLQKVAEKSCRCSLGWLFNKWVYPQ